MTGEGMIDTRRICDKCGCIKKAPLKKCYKCGNTPVVLTVKECLIGDEESRHQQITELCKYVIENHEHGGDIGDYAYTLAKGLIDE